MASVETSTTVLSGAVPEASGRGGRRGGRPPELGIYRMYPYHVPRGAGPVTGGSRGRRDGLVDPGMVNHTRVGKGLTLSAEHCS